MSFEEIENHAIETYNLNMEYLKKNNLKLYEKVNLFESGLNNGLIEPKYDLNYKDGYFDALNLETNEYLYGEDSEEYGKKIVENQLNFSPKNCSFKAFYEVHFTDNVAETALNANIYSDAVLSNAPIIHYVNTSLPKIETMKVIPKMVLLGVGLGTHIPYLHLKAKARIYLIIEPNLEIFRLSLFTIKYYNLSITAQIVFSVADNEQSFNILFDSFHGTGFIYNHYIKHFMFSKNCDMYINLIQNKLVTQGHLTYEFSRLIEGLKRTVSYINEEYKLLNITPNNFNGIDKKPVLFLAAGPSLQKNMEFLKRNRNKYIIVAVYVLMPLLERLNIVPDVVSHYDQAGEIVYDVVKRLSDISFFDNTIFLFASHVDKRVIDSFRKENTFLFQAMYDVKLGFASQTAPSIGEITYALLLRLGAKEIYFLGVDMALDPETNKTHIDEHVHSTNEFKKEKNNKFTLRDDIIKVKGNFREIVNTLAGYKMSAVSLDKISEVLLKDDVNVYNLSDGAYFQKIKPLRAEEINESELKVIDKLEVIPQIISSLNEISEVGFNTKDEDIIILKLDEAKKIKEKIKKFLKTKDSNLMIYEDRLGKLINDICFGNSPCFELKGILLNYIMHNIHYVYYLINMKSLENPKKQLKGVNKILQKQLLKIVDTYIEIYE